MNKNIFSSVICGILLLIGVIACKREYVPSAPFQTTDGSSFLRVIDASPNFRSIYNMPDSFNVLANGNKVTGYLPGGAVLMTYGGMYPTISSAYGYAALPPGQQEIRLSVGTLNPDSVMIKSFTKTLLPNQYYTLLITDSINSNNDSSRMFIRDSVTTPTIGYFNLRFIHAVWNDTAGKNIDVWSTRNNRRIFANVKPGTITGFSQFAYNAQLNDTLYVRRTASGYVRDTLATLSNIAFSNQRTYTIYYRGNANLTTGTKARGLATYIHQ